MPKLDLRNAIRIKGAGGEIVSLKGQGFEWVRPVSDPILAYFQSTGADGAYYPVWDKSTLFQDVDGTVPVENHNDPVALSLDISGNGLHRRQPVSTRRPQYRTDGVLHWLWYDGIDDLLYTDRPFLHNPLGATVIVGLDLSTSAHDRRYLFEGMSTSGNQTTDFYSPIQTRDNDYGCFFRPSSRPNPLSLLSNIRAENAEYLITTVDDPIAEIFSMRGNRGLHAGSVGLAKGTINTNTTSFGGVRRDTESLFVTGREFGFVGVSHVLDNADIEQFENYLVDSTGLTL